MEKKRTYITDYTGDDTIPAFVSFYIEQYKNFKNISGEESMQILSDAGVLDYLAEHYDILHLEGHHWLLKEIDELVESKSLIYK